MASRLSGGEGEWLFAASGDLRDVATLVNATREKQTNKEQETRIVLNDEDEYVVIRNMIILWMLGEGEVEAAIQVWYCHLLSDETWGLMQRFVETCVPGLAETVEGLGMEEEHSVEIPLKSGAKIVARLPGKAWGMLAMWMMAGEIWELQGGAKAATEKRWEVTMKQDNRERYLWVIRPEWRTPFKRWAEEGVMASFQDSAFRKTLTRVNP